VTVKSVLQAPSINVNQQPDRNRLVNMVRKWGDVNTDGLLDASCQIFIDPLIDGFIGYRVESGNAVVLGDPVCAAADKPSLAKAFQQFCLDQKTGVVYIIASEEFASWASHNLHSIVIEFGDKFVLNPLSNPVNHTGSNASLVRKKVKHALKEGALVQEYTGDDPAVEQAIEAVALEWQRARLGPQVYLAQLTLFKNRAGKRWFYAKQGEKIVGILILNQLQAQQGWLLNNVMMTKDAPHGLSELLVITALQALEKEACQSVIIGPVPKQQLGAICGLGWFAESVTRGLYTLAKRIFRLDGHEAFWRKFEPAVYPSYLLFPEKNLSLSSINALLKALNTHF
jgi:lysylphosphatidylglycerol synthetase-like protein (DUF2156 family)